MAIEDFMGDLTGGLQGAGMGAGILGGMTAAKVGLGAAGAMNPWITGGLLGGGALLGIAGSAFSPTHKANKLNDRLGQQEAEMNDLNLKSEKTKQAEDRKKRFGMQQFGDLFSGYMSAMGAARPTGQAGFSADLGV